MMDMFLAPKTLRLVLVDGTFQPQHENGCSQGSGLAKQQWTAGLTLYKPTNLLILLPEFPKKYLVDKSGAVTWSTVLAS